MVFCYSIVQEDEDVRISKKSQVIDENSTKTGDLVK